MPSMGKPYRSSRHRGMYLDLDLAGAEYLSGAIDATLRFLDERTSNQEVSKGMCSAKLDSRLLLSLFPH